MITFKRKKEKKKAEFIPCYSWKKLILSGQNSYGICLSKEKSFIQLGHDHCPGFVL